MLNLRAVVVIPTFNEVENVDEVLAALRRDASELDVLVVDGNSQDGTAERVELLAAADSKLRLIRQPPRQGFAQAYVQGFRDSLEQGYDLICQMDCDLQHAPRYLPQMLARFSPNDSEATVPDAVIASRYIEGGGTQGWPARRVWLSRLGNLYARTILGLELVDLTGGFKCWSRQVLEAIDFDELLSVGFSFQMEMNFRALQAGFRVVEHPILFESRKRGASKMGMAQVRESLILPWRLRSKS